MNGYVDWAMNAYIAEQNPDSIARKELEGMHPRMRIDDGAKNNGPALL